MAQYVQQVKETSGNPVYFIDDQNIIVFQGRQTGIQLFAPSEGTGYEVGGTAIINGCKNLEEAKLFIEFALTPECQEIGQTVGSLQFLTVEGAKDPESAQSLLDMGIKLIDYDSAWTGANKNHLIEAWTGAINADKVATE